MYVVVEKDTKQIKMSYMDQNVVIPEAYYSDDYVHLECVGAESEDEVIISGESESLTASVNLTPVREKRVEEIRLIRNQMLKKSDEKWIELFSQNLDRSSVESDKQVLRDMMEQVVEDLEDLESVDLIKSHDAFANVSLNWNYE